MKKLLLRSSLVAVVVVVVVGAFVYGVLAHKLRLPPYPQLLGLYRSIAPELPAGLATDPKDTRFNRAHRRAQRPAAAPTTSDHGLDAEQQRELEALRALGYAGGTLAAPSAAEQAAGPAGDRRARYLWTDGHAPEAVLMDGTGEVLHRWSYLFDDAFPGHPTPEGARGTGYFRRVALLPGGALLAIYEGQGLIKLDRDSKLLWTYAGRAHHDLEVQADGSIYVLTRKARLLPRINARHPILEDFVTVLSADGQVLREHSILEAVERSPYRSLLQNSDRAGDIFHTNTLEVLDGSHAAIHPAFAAGNVLLSLLEVHAVVVLDPRRGEIVWSLAGIMRHQHQPTMLPDGRMLILDNQGDGGMSRILEVNVATRDIGWTYSGEQHDFFTETCGSVQRLPDGNTLITESDRGRAFEVTPAGEIVWEYSTPNRAGQDGSLIATLFEVLRLPEDEPLEWLSPPAAPATAP